LLKYATTAVLVLKSNRKSKAWGKLAFQFKIAREKLQSQETRDKITIANKSRGKNTKFPIIKKYIYSIDLIVKNVAAQDLLKNDIAILNE